MRPTKEGLLDKSEKAPEVKLNGSYKLYFGANKNLSIAEKAKVVEAYAHNGNRRVTLVFRDAAALTFELSKAKAIEKKANYEGVCQKKKFKAQITF